MTQLWSMMLPELPEVMPERWLREHGFSPVTDASLGNRLKAIGVPMHVTDARGSRWHLERFVNGQGEVLWWKQPPTSEGMAHIADPSLRMFFAVLVDLDRGRERYDYLHAAYVFGGATAMDVLLGMTQDELMSDE